MKNDFEVFKQLSFDEVVSSLDKSINKLCRKFDFIMEENRLHDLLVDCIKDNMDKYTKEIKGDYKSFFESNLDDAIAYYLYTRQDTPEFKYIILNYFVKNTTAVNSIKDVTRIFDKFTLFLDEYNLTVSPEMVKIIIDSSNDVEYLLSFLFEQYKDLFTSGQYLVDFEDQNLLSFVELYAEKNNIAINEENEEVKEVKYLDDESYKDSVKQLLKDVSMYKLLTVDEEKEIGNEIKRLTKVCEKNPSEDNKRLLKEKKESLINANYRLVFNISKKFVGRGLELLDLFQLGCEGLIKAVDKWDVDMGFKFSTYATWWIRQGMSRGLADTGTTIRIPVHKYEQLQKFKMAYNKLQNELQAEPSMEDLKKATNLSEKELDELFRLKDNTVSFETPVGDEDDSELGDFLPDNSVNVEASTLDKTEREELHRVLIEAVRCEKLKYREYVVITLRFGLDDKGYRTLEDTADELFKIEQEQYEINPYQYKKPQRVTRERIRQIEAKALRKLRKNPSIKNMASANGININGILGKVEEPKDDIKPTKTVNTVFNSSNVIEKSTAEAIENAISVVTKRKYNKKRKGKYSK